MDYKGFDRKDYKHRHETVYFNGSDKRITIYDKLREIAAKVKRKDERIKIKKEFIQLFVNGFHYLRLELRLFDHRSFVRHDVGYIVTLGDLQTHYHDLYRVWVKEMNNLLRIIFSWKYLLVLPHFLCYVFVNEKYSSGKLQKWKCKTLWTNCLLVMSQRWLRMEKRFM